MKTIFYILFFSIVIANNAFAFSPDSVILKNTKSEIVSMLKKSTKKKLTFLTVGAFYAVEPFTFVSKTGKIFSHPGFMAKASIGNIYASVRLNYFNKIVNDQQIINEFSDFEYTAGAVFSNSQTDNNTSYSSAGFILGYYPNNWIKSIASTSPLPDEPDHVIAIDATGKNYELENVLIKTHSPIYAIGFKQIKVVKTNMLRQVYDKMDEYEIKHKSKVSNERIYDLTIELLYAPKINYESTIIYSPYGFYAPRTLYISNHFKEKHLGVKLQAGVHFPFGLGAMIEMGIHPGITNLDDDFSKVNLYAKVGFMFNLNLVRQK